jgi:exonuclease VII small subunit
MMMMQKYIKPTTMSEVLEELTTTSIDTESLQDREPKAIGILEDLAAVFDNKSREYSQRLDSIINRIEESQKPLEELAQRTEQSLTLTFQRLDEAVSTAEQPLQKIIKQLEDKTLEAVAGISFLKLLVG